MRTAGTFKLFTVTPQDLVVGMETGYDVKLTASTPIHDKDYLVIDFPAAIGTPGGDSIKKNFCAPDPKSPCAATVLCTAARGSITAQIGTP